MKKLKAFFYVLFKSATSISYYKDLLKVPLGFSIKYLLILAVLASVIISIAIVPSTAKKQIVEIDKFTDGAIAFFPDDLVISIKNGELTMNRTEPFIVKGILAIDVNGTIEDLDRYETAVLINSSNIVVREEGAIKAYPLKDMPDTQVTKDMIVGSAERIDGYLKYLPYALFALIFLVEFFYYFGMKLLYLLIVAVLVMLIGRARGLSLGFSKFYQISLHAMTLPLVIEVVTGIVGFSIGIPMWFLGLNLLVALAAIMRIDTKSSS